MKANGEAGCLRLQTNGTDSLRGKNEDTIHRGHGAHRQRILQSSTGGGGRNGVRRGGSLTRACRARKKSDASNVHPLLRTRSAKRRRAGGSKGGRTFHTSGLMCLESRVRPAWKPKRRYNIKDFEQALELLRIKGKQLHDSPRDEEGAQKEKMKKRRKKRIDAS